MEQHIEQSSGRTTFSNWGGGLLLILGSIFLWITLSPTAANNWWAFFIVMAGLLFVSIAGMVKVKTNGRFPFLVRSNMGISLIIFTVAGMFLFDLNWNAWWPLMIVAPGLGLLYASGGAKHAADNPKVTAVISMSRWISGTMIFLGGTFLLDQLGIFSLANFFGDFRWWGLFILPTALGAFINAVQLRRKGHFPAAESTWWMTSLLVGGTAVQELLGFNWSNGSYLAGIWLIIFGLILLFTARQRV